MLLYIIIYVLCIVLRKGHEHEYRSIITEQLVLTWVPADYNAVDRSVFRASFPLQTAQLSQLVLAKVSQHGYQPFRKIVPA